MVSCARRTDDLFNWKAYYDTRKDDHHGSQETVIEMRGHPSVREQPDQDQGKTEDEGVGKWLWLSRRRLSAGTTKGVG